MKGAIKITSDMNEILGQITGKENFIAIGGLHGPRSAIKFIIDNFVNWPLALRLASLPKAMPGAARKVLSTK